MAGRNSVERAVSNSEAVARNGVGTPCSYTIPMGFARNPSIGCENRPTEVVVIDGGIHITIHAQLNLRRCSDG
eukprot:1182713-Prorocentrum_minimum.AAC.4